MQVKKRRYDKIVSLYATETIVLENGDDNVTVNLCKYGDTIAWAFGGELEGGFHVADAVIEKIAAAKAKVRKESRK